MRPDSISLKRRLASELFGALNWHAWLPSRESRILMYHRITNPEDEAIPQLPGMYVRPLTFRMHLEYLTKYFKVIPLEDLIKNYSRKFTTKEKYVALTFDDAWIDFKTNALPLLEEFNAPATVFVPTKFIDTGELFWNDIVQLALTKGIKIPGQTPNLTDTIETLKKDKLKRDTLTQELKTQLTPELTKLPPQFLSWADIQAINNKGQISFGSHSHSHEISTQISKQELKQDIQTSIEEFKKHNIPMNSSFCYPNQDRNTNTDEVLKTLNFKSSLGLGTTNFNFSRTGVHQDIGSNNNLLSLSLGV